MKINSPAKLNLYLRVVGKRSNGYHEILSIMVPVTLFDELFLERLDSGIKIECDNPSVPKDERNLAFKAAKLYFDAAGIRNGIYIRIWKRIPVAAGLGGGSSNAAAVLKGLNMIYKKLAYAELVELAKKIGADVPFFLYEKPCLAKGIGDILEPLPERKLYFVLITPPIHVSTAWVYNHYNFRLDLTKDEQSSIKKKWKEGKIKALLKNDLERVTIKYFPVINEIKEVLIKEGAEGVLMSGSGPTVFGIFDSEQRAYKVIKNIPVNIGKVFVVSSLTNKYWGVAKR